MGKKGGELGKRRGPMDLRAKTLRPNERERGESEGNVKTLIEHHARGRRVQIFAYIHVTLLSFMVLQESKNKLFN